MENWLPFFYEDALPCLFDYIPNADIILGIDIENALKSKCESIFDYYHARLEALKINNTSEIDRYRPILPELMFFDENAFASIINNKPHIKLSNLSIPNSDNVLNYNLKVKCKIGVVQNHAKILLFVIFSCKSEKSCTLKC